jgi:hypothetical protein
MTASEDELILHVTAQTPSALQENLDSAVEKARQGALEACLFEAHPSLTQAALLNPRSRWA